MRLEQSALAELEEWGVVVLRNFFAVAALTPLRDAAVRCFRSTGAPNSIPDQYRFSASSNSLLLRSLLDFGCESRAELLAPLRSPELQRLFTHALIRPWVCNLEQSWVRKKFAPANVPECGYHLQNWHQDGALGARFPLQPGPRTGSESEQVIPMTELVTCWIPLQDCGRDAPGLEFIRRRQPALLHFTELDDAVVRRRFYEEEFWAPTLEFGDGLVFLNSVLHRTHVHEDMQEDRLSVEYRMFPRCP
jgi:hypothetical protein